MLQQKVLSLQKELEELQSEHRACKKVIQNFSTTQEKLEDEIRELKLTRDASESQFSSDDTQLRQVTDFAPNRHDV